MLMLSSFPKEQQKNTLLHHRVIICFYSTTHSRLWKVYQPIISDKFLYQDIDFPQKRR